MQLVILTVFYLIWLNFLPPLAAFILRDRFNTAVDHGVKWFDKKPLLGPHKTIRGLLATFAGSFFFLPLIPTDHLFDLQAAALLASLGDILTSFTKRRIGRASGQESPVLDQALEGLLPLVYLTIHTPLGPKGAIVVFLLFTPLAFFGASLWHYLLMHPAESSRLRIVRSSARVRAWRACHQPLARWQALLNFENFVYYRLLMDPLFKLTGIYRKGLANALRITVHKRSIVLPHLPDTFDGFRILLLTDLHVDGVAGLAETIARRAAKHEVDLCLLGGDFRMGTYGALAPAMRELKKIIPHVRTRHGIFGVLGNHDCIEMIPDLEDIGVVMLVNDSVSFEQGGKKIHLVGLDDAHYYRTHEPATAFSEVPAGAFSIVLCHSPEAFDEVSPYQPDLYLCGHTHGGQIRLPGRGPLFTHCRAPRFTASGLWQYGKMVGYTSCGVGSSGLPIRFNCPPEMLILTLQKMAPVE